MFFPISPSLLHQLLLFVVLLWLTSLFHQWPDDCTFRSFQFLSSSCSGHIYLQGLFPSSPFLPIGVIFTVHSSFARFPHRSTYQCDTHFSVLRPPSHSRSFSILPRLHPSPPFLPFSCSFSSTLFFSLVSYHSSSRLPLPSCTSTPSVGFSSIPSPSSLFSYWSHAPALLDLDPLHFESLLPPLAAAWAHPPLHHWHGLFPRHLFPPVSYPPSSLLHFVVVPIIARVCVFQCATLPQLSLTFPAYEAAA